MKLITQLCVYSGQKTVLWWKMSDRRRSDRPLPPAPHGENGDGPGGVPDEESNHEVLVAPPESA